ncbi:hypothetical protein D5P86_00720 [Salmonella enterica subsp. enterica serovar Infantis]|nr:hypothetical protein [Salmonella enterica subsp. enterica serovar Infantis]
MSMPAIHFNQDTLGLLARCFGRNKPFFVVRKDAIVQEGKTFGDRVYFADGVSTVTVPRVQGLNLGESFYIAEDGDIYEWQSHFPVESLPCSNNQTEAQAFGLHPIVFHKDSRNS